MNGKNGIIKLNKHEIVAIIELDSKGRALIPYKIRSKRGKKFGLYVTDKAIVLQDI